MIDVPRFTLTLALARKPKANVVFLPQSEVRTVDGRPEYLADDGKWLPAPEGAVICAQGSMPGPEHLDIVVSLVGVMPIPGPVGLDGQPRVDYGEFAELWRGSVEQVRGMFATLNPPKKDLIQ